MNTKFDQLAVACQNGDLELAKKSIFDELNIHEKNDKLVRAVYVTKHFHILRWLLELAEQVGDPYDLNALCEEAMVSFSDEDSLNQFIDCITHFNNRNEVTENEAVPVENEAVPVENEVNENQEVEITQETRTQVMDTTMNLIEHNTKIIDDILGELTIKYEKETNNTDNEIEGQQRAWNTFMTDITNANNKASATLNDILEKQNDQNTWKYDGAWVNNPLHLRMNEPDANTTIDKELIKKLTGGDKWYVRKCGDKYEVNESYFDGLYRQYQYSNYSDEVSSDDDMPELESDDMSESESYSKDMSELEPAKIIQQNENLLDESSCSETEEDMPELEPVSPRKIYYNEIVIEQPVLTYLDEGLPEYSTLPQNSLEYENVQLNVDYIINALNETGKLLDEAISKLPSIININDAYGEHPPKEMVQLNSQDNYEEDNCEEDNYEEDYEQNYHENEIIKQQQDYLDGEYDTFIEFVDEMLIHTGNHNDIIPFKTLLEVLDGWAYERFGPNELEYCLERFYETEDYDTLSGFVFKYNDYPEVETYNLKNAVDLRKEAIREIIDDIQSCIEQGKINGYYEYYLSEGQLKYFGEIRSILESHNYLVSKIYDFKNNGMVIEW
jgi:hypothetical protein